MTPKETVLRALEAMKGDDLERATAYFGRLTEEQLDQEYGASGCTCREIWDGYKKQRQEIETAIKWVEQIKEG